jgi:arabinose-5-phosphate isomerase
MNRKKSDGVADGAGRNLLELGREVIRLEIGGLEELLRSIGPEFERAVKLILGCRGKVIVCGLGKSGIVARKIAATLSSTGTPSVFLHSVDATHGDMGMVTADDLFLAVSKSGGDEEFTRILPYLQEMSVGMIAITGNASSRLAGESDVVLLIPSGKEACPMDLVPTSSTTASLALGDALAVAVLRCRDFDEEDFARLHPSGILGKRLTLTVAELMHTGDEIPVVGLETILREALFEIANKRLGCTAVTRHDGRLEGILTDGDLKRILIKNPDALGLPVEGLMTRSPRTTAASELAVRALEQMEMNPRGPITQLFVTDQDGRLEGIIHMHDILRAGLK